MAKHFYRAQGRYGYIGIELFKRNKGYGDCIKTVITGIKPQKLGRQFADLLNEAYELGRKDQGDSPSDES